MNEMAKDVMKGTLAAYGIVYGAALLIGGVIGGVFQMKAKKALKELEAQLAQEEN